jgi:hypothetical protein
MGVGVGRPGGVADGVSDRFEVDSRRRTMTVVI